MELLSQPGGRSSSEAGPREVLFIVCAGVVLASLDLFIVNVALPQIARDLAAPSLGELSWVLNGYAIVYASLLVFFGRLADRYRRDRALPPRGGRVHRASAACAASTSVGMLVGFRFVQAAGAALLTPTSLGLVLASYEPERRAGAVRAWTATGGLAAALGPVVGGLLVAASWRWVFLVNVPDRDRRPHRRLAPAAPRPRSPDRATRPARRRAGHRRRRPAHLRAGEGKRLGLGLRRRRRHPRRRRGAGRPVRAPLPASRNPLIQPSLFRSRAFTGASLVAVFFSASFGAMLLSSCSGSRASGAGRRLQAGLAIAPGPLMVPLMSFVVGGPV